MNSISRVVFAIVFIVAVQSCSKKTHPSPTVINTNTEVTSDTSVAVKKIDSIATVKPVVKKKPKESIPKVITVNDKYASKSVDGRYYYDLQGHRYWRSNKDGKYYLFNKAMLTDANFKKPE
ncbi:MAG: hypothetical protein ABIQ31_17085 [Ferruginibacter sp.]